MKNLAWLALAGLMALAPVPAASQPAAVPAQRLGKVILGPGTSGDGSQVCATAPTGTVCRTLADRTKDRLSVLDFGAKLDGSTDDTNGFNRARQAAGRDGIVRVPGGRMSLAFTPTLGSTGPILWQMDGTKYADPDLSKNIPVNGIGIDAIETFLDGGKFITRGGTMKTSGPVLRVDSTVTHTDGPPGIHSTFGVNTTANVAAGSSVWSINNIMTSRIPKGAGSGLTSSSQTVGHANMVLRPADALADGLGERSVIWGFLSQVEDRTEQPSNISGVMVNQEWNLAASGDDPNNSRVMHHMTVNRPGNGDQSERIGAPARVGNVSLITGEPLPVGTGSYIGTGYAVRIGWDTAAFDASVGVALNNNAPAVKLAAGQRIMFDGTASSGARSMQYNPGGLTYSAQSGPVFTAFDSGNFSVAGFLIAPALRIADALAPASTVDPTGDVNDVRFSGAYMYRKTTSGWLRFQGSTF